MGELERLIDSTLHEYQRIFEQYDSYPPIHNSKLMLLEIKRVLKKNEFDTALQIIRNQPYLNVGLLASKSLDYEDRFRNYAKSLHQIWHKINSLQKNMFGIKEQRAYEFYRAHGLDDDEIRGQFDGIDFSKSVLKITLKHFDSVFQWNIPSGLQGNHYAAEVIAIPDCLGINDLKADDWGQVSKREQQIYSVDIESVEVLFSYAASVWDTWSITWQPVLTKGGCVQYFYAKDKKHFKKIFP